MLKKFIFLCALLFIAIISNCNSSIDSLKIILRNADSDTLKSRTLFELSQKFKNHDSTLFYLNKLYEVTKQASFENPNDTLLIYYKGVAHASIAISYATQSKELDFAEAQIDSSVTIFSFLKENYSSKNLVRNSLHGLSVSYSILGRIAYTRGDLKAAINYYTNALEIQEQLKAEDGLAKMYNNLGLLYRQQANYSQSIIYHQKALDFFEQNGDSISIANVMVNIAVVAKEIGVYDLSLHNFFKAAEIFKKFNILSSLAATYLNIGDVYSNSSNWPKAMQNYVYAKNAYIEVKDRNGLANSFLDLGVCYTKQGYLDSALFFLSESKDIFEEIGDKIGLSGVYQELGQVYYERKSYDSALRFFQRAEKFAESIGVYLQIAKCKHSISLAYYMKGNFIKGLEYANQALSIANEYDLLLQKRDIHKTLSKLYKSQQQYEKSLQHHEEFFLLYDSINSKDITQKFSDMETLYQLEQKQREINELEKEKALKEIELTKAESTITWQRIHSYISLGVLSFLTFILFMLYIQFRAKRKSNKDLKIQYAEIHQKNEEILAQKEEIESQRNELEHQKEIMKEKSDQLEKFNWLLTDSIDYASSIQDALMPDSTIFEHFFSDHFIMYFPKDVVSGDFYWAYTKNDTIFVVLSDCTGHGVPGGFMSMLGISALTELMVREITDPADILDNLRLLVIESFKQSGKIGEHQDGMDMSLFTYKKGDSFIQFAGANHPLWLIKHEKIKTKSSFSEYKGDRMSISYHFNMKPFNSMKIEVEPNDQIYLFSDGFRDQIGGENFREKYGKENFKQLLISNSHKPMDEQKNILEDAFFRWVGANDQIDDITVIGIKI
ncbi:MAG TPA: tetratricopeptide repeat protein [Tenuifilaceae bacterium]|nr:tetratricopeptide repeat protein [Tenuifilaceae bacterium]HPE18263.1 tetratricopeptide repeat protein [Tenuifilaceae bacterium]HPJ45239.1 tetratricopeptide repeat protein [Tenuifilaceae bacterium]HPQ33360.1 tetratricopeptide repeat protein [Tenuifilaceae bacterium]